MYSLPTYISQTAARLALLERIYHSTLKCSRFGLQVVRRCTFIHDTCYIDTAVSSHGVFNSIMNRFLTDDMSFVIHPPNRIATSSFPMPYISDIFMNKGYHPDAEISCYRKFQGKLVVRF